MSVVTDFDMDRACALITSFGSMSSGRGEFLNTLLIINLTPHSDHNRSTVFRSTAVL